MKAIIFQQQNEVVVSELSDPEPAPGEVVIEVHASGICGTDLEVLHGNYGTSAFPVVPGHEYAGEIVALGSEVSSFSIGDRVVVDPNFECQECRACQKGWAHLCDDLKAYGVTTHGGFAELSCVSAGAVHSIGDMSYEMAALAEPLGCVLNGLSASSAENAENALIFGAGPIGLLLGVGMKVAGIADISFVDLEPARLEFAESFGFKPIAANSSELSGLHQRLDLVVDATGVPAVAGGIVNYIANGGTGLFFGVCPSEARIEIAPFELFRRQITLAGSHSLNHNIPKALETLRSFGEDVSRLVSHRLSLDEVASLLAGDARGDSLKIQYVRG